MTRVALINPDWQYDGSIYFGCRSPHLPLELGISQQILQRAGHQTLLLDAHLFGRSMSVIAAELRTFRPDMVVVTTAPTYLFWRCAPPELRVPQQLTLALQESAPTLVAVGPHGSTTPRAALGKLQVDCVVMGECEATLLRLANGEQPIILAAGRVWDKAKNLAALASIASMLDWPVRIAGASDAEGRAISQEGLRAVLARHTCRQRALELVSIVDDLSRSGSPRCFPEPERMVS
jgi:hypothetical protein